MAGPWARILAQVAVSFGGVFVRAFGQALAQAQAGGGGAAAKEAAKRVAGRMDPKEAMKILNLEESALTHELITERFESIFKANDPSPKVGGSYFLQCKAEHAKNTLHTHLLEENGPPLSEEEYQ